MREIPDDVEMIARAFNMRLHNAKTLGQRTLWIAEAILADRAEREAASPSPDTNVNGNGSGSKAETPATCCTFDPNNDPENENIPSPQLQLSGGDR